MRVRPSPIPPYHADGPEDEHGEEVGVVARGRVVGPDLVGDEVLAVVEGREGDGRHEHRQHLCCDDRQGHRQACVRWGWWKGGGQAGGGTRRDRGAVAQAAAATATPLVMVYGHQTRAPPASAAGYGMARGGPSLTR